MELVYVRKCRIYLYSLSHIHCRDLKCRFAARAPCQMPWFPGPASLGIDFFTGRPCCRLMMCFCVSLWIRVDFQSSRTEWLGFCDGTLTDLHEWRPKETEEDWATGLSFGYAGAPVWMSCGQTWFAMVQASSMVAKRAKVGCQLNDGSWVKTVAWSKLDVGPNHKGTSRDRTSPGWWHVIIWHPSDIIWSGYSERSSIHTVGCWLV